MHKLLPSLILTLLVIFSACQSPTGVFTLGSATTPGSVAANPIVRLVSLDAATFGSLLGSSATGSDLLLLTGAPTCGVDVYSFQYWTLGGAGETTNSSGAIMLPTGGSDCTGPRPILLYAHGTSPSHQYDIAAGFADPANAANGESTLLAAMYAAQGYIVVAPNYAGYNDSSLPYHPYLNAHQQAGEMIDALTAARALIPSAIGAPVSDNGKLMLSGYSQGALVAMATMRQMQFNNQPVTAIATGSGPYALEWFGDAIFAGNVDLGSTLFAPFLAISYQHAYGNIYNTPTDLFSTQYATGIDTLLPTYLPTLALYGLGLLPPFALFNSTTPTVSDITEAGVSSGLAPTLAAILAVPDSNTNPVGALGFGPNYLINNATRIAYVFDAAQNPDGAAISNPAAGLAATIPTNPLRRAFYVNDMRNVVSAPGKTSPAAWAPASPMFLCGGHRDPTVFFDNTTIMETFWGNTSFHLPSGLLTVYDVDPGQNPPADPLQTAFSATISALSNSDLLQQYHGHLVAPFCATASRTFFQNFL